MPDFFNIMRLKGFPVDKARKQLDIIHQSNNLLEWQEGQKWNIFKYHFNKHSFYHSFISNIPKKWEDIRIITKSDLRPNIPLPTFPQSLFNQLYIQQTSGSSGQPFSYSIDYLSHAITWLLVENRYNTANISINDRQARFYGSPISKIDKQREHLKDFLAKRYRFPIMDLSDLALDKWLNNLQKKHYKYLYGYSYPLITFAHYLIRENKVLKNICPTISSCIVTSEMCSPEDQKIIEQGFGIPCFNEYGASEFGIIGFGQSNRWRISDETIFLEIVDEKGKQVKEGEMGKVVCTSLHNTGTPFIRYEIGDLARMVTVNNQRYITELSGRVEAMAVLPSGKKAPGDTAFYYIMKSFTEKHKFISEYRAIQKTPGLFILEIVADQSLSLKAIKTLNLIAESYLEKEIQIDVTRVKSIERTAKGKLQRFIPISTE